jgi:hypothetical protein
VRFGSVDPLVTPLVSFGGYRGQVEVDLGDEQAQHQLHLQLQGGSLALIGFLK